MKAEGLAAEAAMRLADALMAGQLAYPKRTHNTSRSCVKKNGNSCRDDQPKPVGLRADFRMDRGQAYEVGEWRTE